MPFPQKLCSHNKIKKKSTLFNEGSTYCANPKTVNPRIISGKLLCRKEKAKQMQDEKKLQAVMIMSSAAQSFFLWFDLPSHWSISQSELKYQRQIKVFTVFGFTQ